MILMYHNIGTTAGFNTVSVNNLKDQIEFIRKNYDICGIDDYVKTIGENKNKVLITVDDGYESFYEYFYPLISEHNIPAVLYIPVDHVGKFNSWDSQKKINIMDWPLIRTIAGEGIVTIGSHGKSHKRLSGLSVSEQRSEIFDSKNEIEHQISKKVLHFSYPFGQISDILKDSDGCFSEAGYDSACSTRYGKNNHPRDIFRLKRIEVEPSDTMDSFVKKCKITFHKKLLKRYIKELMLKTGLI